MYWYQWTYTAMGWIHEKDLSPKQCTCGCKKFVNKNYDTIDGHIICEYDTHCKECDAYLGHWAYGYYDFH
jgi:hypothetical protein